MKILSLLCLLFLMVGCKEDSLNDLNPMNKVVDAIDAQFVDTKTWNEDFEKLVNDHRKNLGLRSFDFPDDLNELAKKHAEGLAQGTIEFGTAGVTVRCEAMIALYPEGKHCGELIGRGQKTPKIIFDAWLAIDEQRAKLESDLYSVTGFAFARGFDGKFYWTEFFLEL